MLTTVASTVFGALAVALDNVVFLAVQILTAVVALAGMARVVWSVSR